MVDRVRGCAGLPPVEKQMSATQINYRPPGPISRAFMLGDEFFRGIMGPFGSGKSTVCVMEILRKSKDQRVGLDGKRRSRWAVVLSLIHI
jgi:RecA/RadA recombinase